MTPMPEISTTELYRYRAHRTVQDLHGYRRLLTRIREDGKVKEPIEIATDGKHVVVEEGHRRIHIAIELGIKKLPVKITRRQFGRNRRMKFSIGPELAAILNPPQSEEPGASSPGGEEGAQAQQESLTSDDQLEARAGFEPTTVDLESTALPSEH